MNTRLAKELKEHMTGHYQKGNKVSEKFGRELFKVLIDVEDFFYSPFWISRLKRRLREEDIELDDIDISIILGATTDIIDNIRFELFEEGSNMNGMADETTMIGLNTNIDDNELNDSHLYNLLMHELGHKQYQDKYFKEINYLNRKIFGDIKKQADTNMSEEDFTYFTDHNEMRQRIIPVIREMFLNGWSAEDAYFNSPNLIQDDIYKMFSKDYIIYLLKSIL